MFNSVEVLYSIRRDGNSFVEQLYVREKYAFIDGNKFEIFNI